MFIFAGRSILINGYSEENRTISSQFWWNVNAIFLILSYHEEQTRTVT